MMTSLRLSHRRAFSILLAFFALATLIFGASPSPSLSLSSSLGAAPQARSAPRERLRGIWLGQDGRDVVGPYAKPEGNGFQDIHLQVRGLPPNHEIDTLIVRGHGRDEWRSRGERIWLAHIERKPRSEVANIYIEPARVETKREFSIEILFDDQQKVEIYFAGGKADPNLRPASQTLQASWIGQEGDDYAGACVAPGPDGLQDARIDLTHLHPDSGIASVAIEPKTGPSWEFGPNPDGCHRAEIIVDAKDKSTGRLYFQPDRNLQGQPLEIRIAYDNGKSDSATVKAGVCDPKKAVPLPSIPVIETFQPKAAWKQRPDGEVSVLITGLPKPTAPLASMVLTDGVRGSWVWKLNDRVNVHADPESLPLQLLPGREQGRAELRFRPIRDESKSTMTLRLTNRKEGISIGRFAGGVCAPTIAAPAPASTKVVAKPGDDLQALAGRYGTIELTKGVYRLDQPLILDRSLTITSNGGATLLFSQRPQDKPWTAAIKIRRGRTTLNGFAIRFAQAPRWDQEVNYGPAVIGTTDNRDPWTADVLCGIKLTRLYIESPPVSQTKNWEKAIHLIRVISAKNGEISSNALKGGTVLFGGGPWTIAHNRHDGTLPGTYAYEVFSGHQVHDLTFTRNQAKPATPFGLTWRFLVLTQRGSNITVEQNTTERVGPREDDPIPHTNVPETILTESYRLTYEGKASAISADGRLVVIPQALGEPAPSGAVVAVLSGPKAGQWSRIVQAIRPDAYYVDPPLPTGSEKDAIAIASGFVDCRFRNNTINNRGSGISSNLVLAGNHFGTEVSKNVFIGGADSFRICASASEQPHAWGWSHAPFFGGVITGNILEDAVNGGSITVDHNDKTHANRDRVYMTLTLENNTVRWSDRFEAREGVGIRIGDPGALDPGEIRVVERGNNATIVNNRAAANPPILKIVGAQVNGSEIVDRTIPLPPAVPASAAVQSGSISKM